MDVAEAAVLGGDVVVAKLLDAANHGGSSEGKGFASGQRRLRVRCSAPSEAGLEPVPVRVVAVLDPALNKNQRSTRTRAQQENDEEKAMSRHVYSVLEIYGSSPDPLHEAIRNAVRSASHRLP